jgi:hypothetical protein
MITVFSDSTQILSFLQVSGLDQSGTSNPFNILKSTFSENDFLHLYGLAEVPTFHPVSVSDDLLMPISE